jgi:spore germination cell wall hydrolase CwlJ-like protein
MRRDTAKCFLNLDETKLLALCVYGEARGEPPAGKLGVASVVMNRRRAGGWYGPTIREVVLKEKQFSCFNPSDKNYVGLMAIASNWDKSFQKNPALREVFRIAEGVINGDLRDNVFGAPHYNTINCDPEWDDNMQLVAVIGKHEFFAGTERNNGGRNGL